ncbi:MAG: ABC transporter permease subunit [Helicobacteraceae bacterium]|nr:ABC transporter permease subunit [Helicobacteraceae bacterium]
MNLLLKKIFYLLTMLLIISIISFLAIHAAPNSFLSGGELNPNMTPEALAQLKAVYGLDKPLLEQYFQWLINIINMNFGISFVSGGSVLDEIKERLPITLFINIVTLSVVFFSSIYLGILSALNREKLIDKIVTKFAIFSFSMPSFYLALLLILLFSIELDILPIAGLHSIEPTEGLSYYLDMAWHLILPIGVMIFVSMGSMIIYIRSLTLEIIKSDYYFFALSRGLSQSVIIKEYIFPNLLPPVITLLGLSLPGLIGGSVILEAIFSIEGMGQLFYLSAMSRDYPVIMGILIISAFLTLLGNILADLTLLKLNPHIKGA